jgi:hypothetical protein
MRWVEIQAAGDGPGPRSSRAACAAGSDFFAYGGELEPRRPVDAALYRLRDGAWSKVRPRRPRRAFGTVRCTCGSRCAASAKPRLLPLAQTPS